MRGWQRTTVAVGCLTLAAPAAAQPYDHHDHGHYHDHGHHHGGAGGFGTGSWLSPGFGGGYGGFGYSSFGPGYSSSFNYYNGPVGGPLIAPPIYYGPSSGGYGGYGNAGYGVYGPAPGVPNLNGYYGPDPVNNRLRQLEADADWRRFAAQAAAAEVAGNATLAPNPGDPTRATTTVLPPSSPAAQLRSLRFQGQGDEAFHNQDYNHAFSRYKSAVEAAGDRGEARFRLGYAMVALGRYELAVEQFKRGLAADPALAVTGVRLDELYGPDNALAKTAHFGRATQWAKQDIRDPDRLFLLGVLLTFDGDARAREILEAAWQLAGRGQHLAAMLDPPEVRILDQPAAAAEESAPAGAAPPRPGRPEGADPLFPLPSAASEAGPALPPLPTPNDDPR